MCPQFLSLQTVYEPFLNGNPATQHIEHNNATEVRDGIPYRRSGIFTVKTFSPLAYRW